MNKKILKPILVVGSGGIIATGIIIPIVLINKKKDNNNDKETEKDIKSIKTILDKKTGNDLIISLASDTTGNIIGKKVNKTEIEKQLKILVDSTNDLGASSHDSLKGVEITISMTEDKNIGTDAQDIIVTLSKGGYDHTTTKTFQVKRDQTLAEVMKAHLVGENLNIVLPQGASTLYDTDIEVLAAIKVVLESRGGITSVNTATIAKKSGEGDVTSVATHRATATNYKITVGGTDYTLKLNQAMTADETAIAAIKAKITDTALAIGVGVDTSNDGNILTAIKAQLKTDNPSLSASDLAKITDNIALLKPGTATSVALTITINSASDTIIITVTKAMTADETAVKTIKDKITDMTLAIGVGVDTSNDGNILTAIKTQLKTDNPSLSASDLAKITDNIALLKPGTATSVALTITINGASDTIIITVTKAMTADETAVKTIKDKITDTVLLIGARIDTTTNEHILAAIKAQLKTDNPSLSASDLAKITDSISSLITGTATTVILTITVRTALDRVSITVTKVT